MPSAEARALAIFASLQYGWGEDFATNPVFCEMQQGLRDQVTADDFMRAELEWKRETEKIGWG